MFEEIFLYTTLFFIWKASGKTWKVKPKKKEKWVTTINWSGTQDSKLRESVFFSNKKEISPNNFFFFFLLVLELSVEKVLNLCTRFG